MLHSELFDLVPHLHAMYQRGSAADSRSNVNRLGHLFGIGTLFQTRLGERIDAIQTLDGVRDCQGDERFLAFAECALGNTAEYHALNFCHSGPASSPISENRARSLAL